jgi:PAS domain S-box-containing protein
MTFFKLNLQSKLTIQFSILFVAIAAFIYFYYTNKYEEQLINTYKYKAAVFIKYFENNPNAFTNNKFTDPLETSKLLSLNEAIYLVYEDSKGQIEDAINLGVAEEHLYIQAKSSIEGISKDDRIYRLVLPINNKTFNGKIYIGFKNNDDSKSLFEYRLVTGLFSIAIIICGIILTYILSSLLLLPLSKILKSIESVPYLKEKPLPKTNNQVGIIADRVNYLLNDYNKTITEVESLNKKLHDVFKDKIVELNLEINQRKKIEISLQKSEEQFRLVFQNAPIGIVIISLDGIIISVNKSFCDTIGFSREEIIGIPIKYLFERKNIEGFSKDRLALDDIHVANINSENVLLKKEGNEINVIVKSVSVLDEKGKIIQYVMQILDISEIKRTQKELVEALNKAEESDKLKSAFLAQMSHEIRTPLNVILTSIPLIAEEIPGDDEELKIILDSVKSAGRRLQRTIDMILSMSSVQSGNYKPTYENFDLVPDLQNMVNEFKSLTDDKGLKLKFTHSNPNAFVIADRYTINQVFQNIINNALKYTLKGYIEVSVKNIKDDKVRVEVKDTGIGMSKDYLQKMFVPFSQEDAGHKRQFEGNGLGLALVKKYLELNRAEIIVQSEKNVGSVFTVEFDRKINFTETTAALKEQKSYSI